MQRKTGLRISFIRIRILDAIEPAFQDRLDVAIRSSTDAMGPRTSGFEPHIAIAFGEPQNAQTRSVALFPERGEYASSEA